MKAARNQQESHECTGQRMRQASEHTHGTLARTHDRAVTEANVEYSKQKKSPKGLAHALANNFNLKANLLQLGVVQDEAPVKDKRRLGQCFIHLGIVVLSKLVPLCENHDGMGAVHGCVRVLLNGHKTLNTAWVAG